MSPETPENQELRRPTASQVDVAPKAPVSKSVLSLQGVIGSRIKRLFLAAGISLGVGSGLAVAGRELVYDKFGTSSQEVNDYIESPEVVNRKSWTEILDGSPEAARELEETVANRQAELSARLTEIEAERAALEGSHQARLETLNNLNTIELDISQFISELENIETEEEAADLQSRLAGYVSGISESFLDIRNTLARVLVNTINNSTGSFRSTLEAIMTFLVDTENDIQNIRLDIQRTYAQSEVKLAELSDTIDKYSRLYDELGTIIESLKANSVIAVHELLFYIQLALYSMILFKISNAGLLRISAKGVIANNAELTSAVQELEKRFGKENAKQRQQILKLNKIIAELTQEKESRVRIPQPSLADNELSVAAPSVNFAKGVQVDAVEITDNGSVSDQVPSSIDASVLEQEVRRPR
jgi:hypothetical protein